MTVESNIVMYDEPVIITPRCVAEIGQDREGMEVGTETYLLL